MSSPDAAKGGLEIVLQSWWQNETQYFVPLLWYGCTDVFAQLGKKCRSSVHREPYAGNKPTLEAARQSMHAPSLTHPSTTSSQAPSALDPSELSPTAPFKFLGTELT